MAAWVSQNVRRLRFLLVPSPSAAHCPWQTTPRMRTYEQLDCATSFADEFALRSVCTLRCASKPRRRCGVTSARMHKSAATSTRAPSSTQVLQRERGQSRLRLQFGSSMRHDRERRPRRAGMMVVVAVGLCACKSHARCSRAQHVRRAAGRRATMATGTAKRPRHAWRMP